MEPSLDLAEGHADTSHTARGEEQEAGTDPPENPELSEAKGLTRKDWVTLTFSASALAVSAASFYFSALRVDESVQARIADTEIAPGTPNDNIQHYKHGFVVAHYAFVNTGNRPSVVLVGDYMLSRSPTELDRGFGWHAETLKGIFPLLLPPHDIRVVDLRVPINWMIENYDNGAESQNPNSTPANPEHVFYCGFTFKTLDSRGVVHNSEWKAQFHIDVTKSGWAGMGPMNSTNQYPATELLKTFVPHSAP